MKPYDVEARAVDFMVGLQRRGRDVRASDTKDLVIELRAAFDAGREVRTDYPRIDVGSRVCLAKVAGTVARRSENDPTAWRVTWPSGTQTSHPESDLMIASAPRSANPKADE